MSVHSSCTHVHTHTHTHTHTGWWILVRRRSLRRSGPFRRGCRRGRSSVSRAWQSHPRVRDSHAPWLVDEAQGNRRSCAGCLGLRQVKSLLPPEMNKMGLYSDRHVKKIVQAHLDDALERLVNSPLSVFSIHKSCTNVHTQLTFMYTQIVYTCTHTWRLCIQLRLQDRLLHQWSNDSWRRLRTYDSHARSASAQTNWGGEEVKQATTHPMCTRRARIVHVCCMIHA